MAHITDPANPTPTFGYSFNYESWVPGTIITLCNVPWNNDFKDVVRFGNRGLLDQYIDNLENTTEEITHLSPVKRDIPIRISTPVNSASRFNYLRASNPLSPVQGDTQKNYYYFILDVREIAPNTTELILQLDVFQTFIYDVEFGNSYIERGHIGIANQKAFDSQGRDYLSLPEGLDLGAEYVNVHKAHKQIMGKGTSGNYDDSYNVLVVSNIDILAAPGTVANPTIISPRPNSIQGVNTGVGVWLFETGSDWSDYVESVKNTPWITQGIMSITLVPDIRRYLPSFTFQGTTYKYASGGIPSNIFPVKHKLLEGWRESEEVTDYIPERYRHLDKLLTYPYCIIELTTNTGTPIILKPESWNDDDLTVVEIPTFSPGSQRISFHPYKYNAREGATDETYFTNQLVDDQGDWLDNGTIITEFPTVAVMNNNGILFLANNANQLAFSAQSADWAQQVALRSNQVGYDQASGAMNAMAAITGNNMNAARAQTGLQNQLMSQQYITSAIGNLIGGPMSGAMAGAVAGPGGAAAGGAMATVGSGIQGITGAFNVAAQMEANVKSNSINANNSLSNFNAQNSQAGYVRDTNKSLADWAAKGDYENTIAGINARTQDAQMVPPSTLGQVGGATTNLIHRNMRVVARIKMLDAASMRRVGEYWLRYGIAVRQFAKIPASLMVMSKFTYWKLLECYIINAEMPEGFKQVIRGILEKGVTVWANPNDIGRIDLADNVAIEGINL